MRTSTYRQHSLTIREHRFDVPLDHYQPVGPDNPTIEIFAREIIRQDGEDLPFAIYMQGGPGGAGPRVGNFGSGWTGRLVRDYRLVIMDQRGTGQSGRLDELALSERLEDPDRLARYLKLFRQDQIVADAEMLRAELTEGKPWLSLGQSYGGFINTSYLSTNPEGLSGVLFTGGLPGLAHIDDIYRLTYERTAARNRVYFEQFPDDERVIREVAAHLRDTEEFLPSGERLTPARFRMVGLDLGMQTAFDVLHYLFEGPFVTVGGQRRLSREFMHGVASRVTLTPMYAALHETIYACATPELSGTATAWSADRLAHEITGFHPDADPLDMTQPYYLTGEHMMRSLFEEDPRLRPLAAGVDRLAESTDWPAVYSPPALANNEVPAAAAIFYDDMFVPRELSLDTAATIRGTRTWITNEYQHDGLRASGEHVVNHLLRLLHD